MPSSSAALGDDVAQLSRFAGSGVIALAPSSGSRCVSFDSERCGSTIALMAIGESCLVDGIRVRGLDDVGRDVVTQEFTRMEKIVQDGQEPGALGGMHAAGLQTKWFIASLVFEKGVLLVLGISSWFDRVEWKGVENGGKERII